MLYYFFFFLMIRRPPRSTQGVSSAASDVYKRQSIYNKKELCYLLDIKDKEKINITDSQIILLAYKKWNQECPKYLVGDFAFVIYDEKEDKILCVKDHMGSRSLYYSYENNIFSFSTVIETLKSNKELNERWICDLLALGGVVHQFEPEETIYNNVYQVLPATAIIIQGNKLIKYKYWDCLLYTSDAADDTPCVDLGGRRIIKKKKKQYNILMNKN
eukprot:TRINITY_DN8698_c0_g1_i1.p1 TRINITY_DN8698_c0_g1~~TRINITY_DN8698_c0_g1_i1.p1  ORF type:complete len:216 (-),score=55.14 TRINITY_DN8698_c0_g1_i1:74-721(-)